MDEAECTVSLFTGVGHRWFNSRPDGGAETPPPPPRFLPWLRAFGDIATKLCIPLTPLISPNLTDEIFQDFDWSAVNDARMASCSPFSVKK